MKINNFSYDELFKLAIQKPVMAQVEVTRNCDQACIFCFRYCSPIQVSDDLSLLKWKKVIRDLTSIGIEELNFSGGEIFFYKEVDKLFAYAKKHGIKKITVNTNGQVELKNKNLSDIDELVFSIHGISLQHDSIVNKKDAYLMVKKQFLFALKNFNGDVGINTVVCEANINDLKEIYREFENYKLKFHAFNFYIEKKLKHSEKLEKDFKKYLNFLKTIPLERRKLRHGMQNILLKNPKINTIQLPDCAAGKYKIIVDFEGNIYPCRYFQEKDYFCGNILNKDIETIWHEGKGFNFFRKQFLNKVKSCEDCKKITKCAGGCMAWRKKGINEKDIRCEFGHAYTRA